MMRLKGVARLNVYREYNGLGHTYYYADIGLSLNSSKSYNDEIWSPCLSTYVSKESQGA